MPALALIKRNIAEIREDSALTFYGAALAFCYLLTAVFLFRSDHYAGLISRDVQPICWPFFESCYQYRWLSNFEIRILVLAMGALSLVPLISFLRRKTAFAYGSLLCVAALHALMFIQDFRNTQNQYYMLFWTVFVYLFWPGKRRLLHYLILSFYFWAGRIKLNRQWLSGQGLYEKLWFIPTSLNSAACIYVVILEMVVIWGLVSKNKIWFWATLAQLALFHLISTSQVGFYYPLLMVAILSVYPMSRLLDAEPADISMRMERKSWMVLGLFAFLQVYPSLVSKDRAISGVGRTFSLNMFEGIFDCNVRWIEHHKDGRLSTFNAKDKETARLECEPIYYYAKTKIRCRRMLASDPSFVDLDFQMEIKRVGDPAMQPLIDRSSFCGNPPTFNLFFPNSWIRD